MQSAPKTMNKRPTAVHFLEFGFMALSSVIGLKHTIIQYRCVAAREQ